MDQLVFGELKARARDVDSLVGEAANVNFDAAFGSAVERDVLEAIDVEIAIEFAINAFEQVQVECSRHTGSVIVGEIEYVRLFLQIDADKHFASRPQDAGVVGEECDSRVRLEIPDRGAREKPDALSLTG